MGNKRQPPVSSSVSDEDSSSSSEHHMAVEKETQDSLLSDHDSEEDDAEEEEADEEEEVAVDGKSTTKVTQEDSSTSDSDTSSASGGKPQKSPHEFIVLQRKPEPSAKSSFSEKVSPPQITPKPRLFDTPKRANESKSDRKASAKKQKKEISVQSFKPAEKSGKEISVPSFKPAEKSGNTEKKKRKDKLENTEKVSKSEKLEKEKVDKIGKGENNKKNSKDSHEPFSPSKPKLWTHNEEVLLLEILDSTRGGLEIPLKKTDEFWIKLIKNLQGKLERRWSKEQVFEKVRRMKGRYVNMAAKIKKAENKFRFRSANDKELFGLWDQIWGTGDKPKIDESGEKIYSDSEEIDKHASSQENKLKAAEMDIVKYGIQNGGSSYNNKSMSDIQKFIQQDVRNSLSLLEEKFTQVLTDLQGQTRELVGNVTRVVASQSRTPNGFNFGLQGLDYFPAGNSNMMSLHDDQEDESLQQQWLELQLQELDVYQQRLQLIQKECQVKEEQLKLRLQKGK